MDDGNNNASDNSTNVTRRAAVVPHEITPSCRQGHRANSHSVTVGTSSAYSIYLRQHPHTSPIPHPPHPLPKVSHLPTLSLLPATRPYIIHTSASSRSSAYRTFEHKGWPAKGCHVAPSPTLICMLAIGSSVLAAGCWMLDVGCWMRVRSFPSRTDGRRERTTWRLVSRVDSTASPRLHPSGLALLAQLSIFAAAVRMAGRDGWAPNRAACQDFSVHGPYCSPQSSPRLLTCDLLLISSFH